jgi:hypothetical protein
MWWLRTIDPARLYLKYNVKLYKLTEYQLLEILNYQSNKEYNRKWLVGNSHEPYFNMVNGYKKKIVYTVDD